MTFDFVTSQKCGFASGMLALQSHSMPSGKIHDAITFLLAAPAFAATYAATYDLSASVVVAVAFVLGGLMFGPDLDTISRQYTRCFCFKSIWWPYRSFFKHRSRFSHGLIFGALIRVVYLMGVLTLGAFLTAYAYAIYVDGEPPDLVAFASHWRSIIQFVNGNLGGYFLVSVFTGTWLGAASHTFTDMAGSFIKTIRAAKFL